MPLSACPLRRPGSGRPREEIWSRLPFSSVPKEQTQAVGAPLAGYQVQGTWAGVCSLFRLYHIVRVRKRTIIEGAHRHNPARAFPPAWTRHRSKTIAPQFTDKVRDSARFPDCLPCRQSRKESGGFISRALFPPWPAWFAPTSLRIHSERPMQTTAAMGPSGSQSASGARTRQRKLSDLVGPGWISVLKLCGVAVAVASGDPCPCNAANCQANRPSPGFAAGLRNENCKTCVRREHMLRRVEVRHQCGHSGLLRLLRVCATQLTWPEVIAELQTRTA